MKIENEELIFRKIVKHFTVDVPRLEASLSVELVVLEDVEFGDYDTDITPLMDSDKELWEKLTDEEQDELKELLKV